MRTEAPHAAMLRLDPHLAVFRSAPDRIVIDAQQPVVELDADESTLRGIAALTRGVVRRELEHLLGDDPAAELLEAVEPALQLAPPLLPVLVLFVAWDILGIVRGHWWYSADYTTGILLPARVPLEELVFFVVIPICGLLTYEAVGTVLG